MIKPVILAGGFGSRLWPLSKPEKPKQFLDFISDNPSLQLTMFQSTFARLGSMDIQKPLVLSNKQHVNLIAEQLKQINICADIILEPQVRNTAPAIAIAALKVLQDGDSLLLILPSDHLIDDIKAFESSVERAIELAQNQMLVTFGVQPITPETSYGYIEQGEVCGKGNRVKKFVEKPDLDTAKKYLQSGKYYWNSGIFLFRASRYLQELEKYRPDILSNCRLAIENSFSHGGIGYGEVTSINSELFSKCPTDSIDYAVMEKTQSAAIVPLQSDWCDLGSWEALKRKGIDELIVKGG